MVSMAITINFGGWVFGLTSVYTEKTKMVGENYPKYSVQPAMNSVMLHITLILLKISEILRLSIWKVGHALFNSMSQNWNMRNSVYMMYIAHI